MDMPAADAQDTFRARITPWLTELAIAAGAGNKWSARSIKMIQHAIITHCALRAIETKRTSKCNMYNLIEQNFTMFMDDKEGWTPPPGLTRERLCLSQESPAKQHTGKTLWDAWVATRAECMEYLSVFCGLFPAGKFNSGEQPADARSKFRKALSVKDRKEKAAEKAKAAARKAAKTTTTASPGGASSAAGAAAGGEGDADVEGEEAATSAEDAAPSSPESAPSASEVSSPATPASAAAGNRVDLS